MQNFDKLNKRFGLHSAVPELSAAMDDYAALTHRQQHLTSAVTIAHTSPQLPTMRDQEYLLYELKDLISCSKEALSKLHSTLKPGISSRAFEVYAKLADAITSQLRELRELNKAILDLMMFSPGGKDSGESGTLQLTGEQLIDLVKKAREGSEMNRIDAVFDVVEEAPSKGRLNV